MSWHNVPENYEDYVGFVYLITELDTGMKYIGKTSFWYTKKRKPNKYILENGKYKKDKKGKRILSKRKTKKHIRKETDWRNYNSSNKILQKKIAENPDNYRKEIISCHKTVTDLLLEEAYLQIKTYKQGEWDNYYNEVINLRVRIR